MAAIAARGGRMPSQRPGERLVKRQKSTSRTVASQFEPNGFPHLTASYLAVDLANRVTIILVMSDVLPLAEVKAKFSEMVDRVEQQHDRITVTRNGRPAAVLMSADDLAALEDTLELLSDPTAMAEIEQARREVAAGNIVSADEIRAKYLH